MCVLPPESIHFSNPFSSQVTMPNKKRRDKTSAEFGDALMGDGLPGEENGQECHGVCDLPAEPEGAHPVLVDRYTVAIQ